LIIQGNRALARACAVHIKGLIDHYAFRNSRSGRKTKAPLTLRPNDSWQPPFIDGDRAREIRFFMGTLSASAPVVVGPPQGGNVEEKVRPKPKKAAKKSAAKKKPAKKALRKVVAKKATRKSAVKKASAKHSSARRAGAKKSPGKKAANKSAAKRAPAKRKKAMPMPPPSETPPAA
jgi:hypothetical protein